MSVAHQMPAKIVAVWKNPPMADKNAPRTSLAPDPCDAGVPPAEALVAMLAPSICTANETWELMVLDDMPSSPSISADV